jgi:anthranilate synthase component 1
MMQASVGTTSIMPATIAATVREQAEKTYTEAVERIKEYIHAGDVFQVNLSRQWDLQLNEDVPHEWLFRRLRSGNPAPFSGLMRWRNTTVISSSPERLVKISGGLVETRPIAGTHPRSHASDDARQETEALLRHPKERAEHIMLIDLERNDLGRVCEPGSVQVDEMMSLESYRHVHHIVSNVRGSLKAGTGPGAVIRAVFPGGTITGCPKVRCMEIIAELEAEARGAYTGSFGYLDSFGRLDLNILIRSMTCHGRNIVFRAGAGIVADSIAARELEETRAKARGLLRVFSDTP